MSLIDLDEAKKKAIIKLCDGCTKKYKCGLPEDYKFYNINFGSDKPCIQRRAMPQRRK